VKVKENSQDVASSRSRTILSSANAADPKEPDPIASKLFRSLDPDNVGFISKYMLIDRLHHMGIRSDDPRVAPLTALLMKAPNDYLQISLNDFIELTKPYSVLIQKALQGRFIIPEFSSFCKTLTAIFNTVKENREGEVASYIPQLAKVSPHKFGMSLCTIDGQMFSLGDTKEYFSIQSISKTINYCLALDEFGENVVHNHVGREPSGSSFNAITLDSQNRPHNPMINAGAIMACSMIMPHTKPAERFDYVLSVWERLAGTVKPLFNNTVYLSEKQHADRNFALAYFMSDKKKFPKNTSLLETLDLYFQCCSIELTSEGMAIVAATLAKGGINPLTGERILTVNTVKNCLSLMNSCGMYDFSGEFAFTIGLPAKSGVGGGLMIVVPNVMGFCVWAPPLDQNGNTVKGVHFCRELVRSFNFHNYDSLVSGESEKMDPRRKLIDIKVNSIVALCWAASQGDINEMQQLLATGVDLNESDYDGRTPLHLAASEGHLEAVQFLVKHGASIYAKDRWGNTPMDDAARGKHASIVECFKATQK
jgi:glutaminase